MTPHVTQHAIKRFKERVRDVPDDEAIEALSTPFIVQAIKFGAPYVRLGTGHHVVIEDGRIVTVLPREHSRQSMTRERDWKFKQEAARG